MLLIAQWRAARKKGDIKVVTAHRAVLLSNIIPIDSLEYLNNFLSMYVYFHYITLVSFPDPLPMEDSPSAKPCHPCSKGAPPFESEYLIIDGGRDLGTFLLTYLRANFAYHLPR